jgi:hypothetical protein
MKDVSVLTILQQAIIQDTPTPNIKSFEDGTKK